MVAYNVWSQYADCIQSLLYVTLVVSLEAIGPKPIWECECLESGKNSKKITLRHRFFLGPCIGSGSRKLLNRPFGQNRPKKPTVGAWRKCMYAKSRLLSLPTDGASVNNPGGQKVRWKFEEDARHTQRDALRMMHWIWNEYITTVEIGRNISWHTHARNRINSPGFKKNYLIGFVWILLLFGLPLETSEMTIQLAVYHLSDT